MRFSDCMSWAACCGRLIFEPGSDVRGNDGDFRGNSIGGGQRFQGSGIWDFCCRCSKRHGHCCTLRQRIADPL